MSAYNVTLSYEDRNKGSEGRTIKVDASSMAGAIGNPPDEIYLNRRYSTRRTARGK